jgi:hypothetical protein
MRKEIAAGAFFLAMLAASLLNVRYLEELTAGVSRSAGLAAEAASARDWEAAERHAAEAFDGWETRSGHTRLVLRHSAIEAAENSIILMLTEVYAKDPARVRGASEAVRCVMESISDTERVRFGSVF